MRPLKVSVGRVTANEPDTRQAGTGAGVSPCIASVADPIRARFCKGMAPDTIVIIGGMQDLA
jgi:hypothetical protein